MKSKDCENFYFSYNDRMKKLIWLYLLFAPLAMAKVTVVDGDSLEIDGSRIRLDGIDAPEFFQMCSDSKGKEYECGQVSKNYLQNLVSAHEVQCQCLPETDKYKRKVCECFANKISLNRTMISSGHARAYRSEKYEEDEKAAAQNYRGIWQGKHMRPALYRILHRRTKK